LKGSLKQRPTSSNDVGQDLSINDRETCQSQGIDVKRLILCLCILAAAGCTFHRNGSQAITIDPFHDKDEPGIKPADGFGYDHGVPLDNR
jgi:hypothetical protein